MFSYPPYQHTFEPRGWPIESNVWKVTYPATRAVKCPVCDGRGRLSIGAMTADTTNLCHGCDGKGWVAV